MSKEPPPRRDSSRTISSTQKNDTVQNEKNEIYWAPKESDINLFNDGDK